MDHRTDQGSDDGAEDARRDPDLEHREPGRRWVGHDPENQPYDPADEAERERATERPSRHQRQVVECASKLSHLPTMAPCRDDAEGANLLGTEVEEVGRDD